MREHKFSLETLIGGWYISESVCDDMINYFDTNKDKHVKTNNIIGKKGIVDDTRMSLDKYNKPKPFQNYCDQLDECLKKYKKKYEDSKKSPKIFLSRHTNLQKYNPGQGYYKWHFEDTIVGQRFLVFMTYLNDVDDGGTEFKYQNLTTPAKKGLTLIWPVYWTHTHRGQISNTQTKYITTGWFDFYE
jgi:hypothetical protein